MLLDVNYYAAAVEIPPFSLEGKLDFEPSI